MAIRSFRHKGLKRLYDDGEARDVPADLTKRIADLLSAIDEASRPQDVGLFPGWRLHPLKGNLKGFWSVSVAATGALSFALKKVMHSTLIWLTTIEGEI
jgi:proteic killer suppression protein